MRVDFSLVEALKRTGYGVPPSGGSSTVNSDGDMLQPKKQADVRITISEKPMFAAPRDGTIVGVWNLENNITLAMWDQLSDPGFWCSAEPDVADLMPEIDFEPTGWFTEIEVQVYRRAGGARVDMCDGSHTDMKTKGVSHLWRRDKGDKT